MPRARPGRTGPAAGGGPWPPAAGRLPTAVAPWLIAGAAVADCCCAVAACCCAAACWALASAAASVLTTATVRRVVRRATPATLPGVRGAPTTAWASDRPQLNPSGVSGATPAEKQDDGGAAPHAMVFRR